MDVKGILSTGKKFVIEHLPTIVMGAGISGFITTIILTADEVPKAKEELKKAKTGVPGLTEKELTFIDKVKIVAPICWPMAATGVASIGCIVFANSMNLKRNAAALAAYQLSESSVRNFKEAALKTVGEKKTEEILDLKDKEAVKKCKDRPVVKSGEMLIFDSETGVMFSSTKTKIEQARNEVNYMVACEDSACVNDFYSLLGIPEDRRPNVANTIGWYTGPGTEADMMRERWSFMWDDDGVTTIGIISYDWTVLPFGM